MGGELNIHTSKAYGVVPAGEKVLSYGWDRHLSVIDVGAIKVTLDSICIELMSS